MSTPPATASWNALTGMAFSAAPLFVLVYGVVRLLDGLDGARGPGTHWTAGHAAFLVGLLLFVPVVLGLRRPVAARAAGLRVTATVSAVVAVLGIAAAAGQVVIDLVVGLRAGGREEMNRLFEQVQAYPAVRPVFYTVGPVLFYVGLLALIVLVAGSRPRPVSGWSPVLVVAGTVMMAVDLDLIPLGAACYWLALAPLGWRLAWGDRALEGAPGAAVPA
ncbi:hypothetical protein [Sphaerisporangium corydalis]|uniref:DUF4386 domain-containing protein n=1 Tax=Sphaerisporangium corydalis TaxID=1441875 RepID=A0ABV9EAG7_9ACTN|nr:hypothetical protein [Sphaerisporangium corydalis]